MKKKIVKQLKQVAAEIPVSYYEVNVYKTMTGEEAAKHVEDDLEPDKKYTLTFTSQREVNHLRRLKRYFTKYGEEGIQLYLDQSAELFVESLKPMTVGGIQIERG